MRALLESFGVIVAMGASAAEGLALLQAGTFDLLLSDVGMPGEDGYAFLEKVRKLPADSGGRVPAVALTAYTRSEDRTRALLAGFSTHLGKPVEPEELVAVIASLTGSAMRREV